MPARRPASRSLAFSLAILVVALAVTTACANSTTKARPGSGTATPSPTATPTLPTSSQVMAYVGAGEHVYALNGHTGAVKWTYVTGHGTALGGIDGVAVMAGMVFAHGTGAGADGQPTRTIYALDAATGALRWTLQPPTHSAGSPSALTSAGPVAVVGDVLYLVAGAMQAPHGTYAVDLKTGAVLWAAEGIAGGTAIDDRAVYVAQTFASSATEAPSNGQFTALDRMTGAQLWQLRGHPYDDVLLSAGILYTTTSLPAALYALDPVTGAARWTKPVDGYGSVRVIGPSLLATDRSGISALDPATGQERWRFTSAGGAGVEGEGATLCLAYRDQNAAHFVGVDASTGVQRWTRDMSVPSGGYGGSGGSGGGACYAIASSSGAGDTVYRLDTSTGGIAWSASVGGGVASGLHIYADAIYAVTVVDRYHTAVKALAVADGSMMWQFTPEVDLPGTLAVG